jgi:uncharacterized repeat protein (TIGR02543 family)
MKRFFNLLVIFALLSLAFGAALVTPARALGAPIVTTLAATNITPTSVTLNGVINADGVDNLLARFRYSTMQDWTWIRPTAVTATPATASGTSDTPISANITGLQPDTQYYFVADYGGSPGAQLSFTTPPNIFGFSPIPLTLPSGLVSGSLLDIWGSMANDVYAVGYGTDGSNNYMPLIYHYDGTNWAPIPLSLPSGWQTGELYGAWGSAANDIYAVGDGAGIGSITLPLIYHYDGSNWTAITPDIPSGWTYVALNSVWGTGANDVYAVAEASDSNWSDTSLIYHYDGTSWTQIIPIPPSGWLGIGTITGVWGSAWNDVYVLGAGTDGSRYPLPWAYHYDGSVWTSITPALPGGLLGGVLSGAWGSGANDIFAVGNGINASYNNPPLMYRFDWMNWYSISLSLPSGWQEGKLSRVWGSASNNVYAVGEGSDGSANSMPLVYYHDGLTWTPITPALPSGWQDGKLFGAWGTVWNDVYAVGKGYDGSTWMPLVYQWAPAYTVTYNANNADNGSIPADQTKIENVGLTLADNSANLVRTGYIFNGWNTQNDGLGTHYDVSATYTDNAYLTLYAEWKINSYTVSFDAQGGAPAPGNQTVAYGNKITKPSDPSKTGYTFAGWYNGNTVWDFANDTVSGVMTLTAHWTAINYTVSFDAQGGTPAPGNQTVAYGNKVTKPSDPSKTGYTFAGWYTGNTAWDFANDTVSGAMTLTAHWTAINYTVSFDAQGGTPAPGNQTVAYGNKVTKPSDPSKSSYTFAGWYNGNTAWDFANDTVSGAMTLTAHWTASAAAVAVSPTSKDFGIQVVGTSSTPFTFTLTNSGASNLTVSGVTASSEFTVSSETCTAAPIAPKGTCTFSITFTPASSGDKTGSLTVTSNAASSPNSVSLSGKGVVLQTLRVRSVGAYDGSILESALNSGIGGNFNSSGLTINVGDDTLMRQAKGILDFDTSSLPDTAVITIANLQIKVMSFSQKIYAQLGNLTADMTQPYFSNSLMLQKTDFQAAARVTSIGTFAKATTTNQWIAMQLVNSSLPAMNLLGHTQFRLYFTIKHNNDGISQQLNLLSGDNSIAADRPLLIITYYVP